MRIEASGHIARPPAEVFRHVAVEHWQNHPRWDSNILSIEPLTPGPIRTGSRARVRRRRGGGDDEVLEVLEFEPDRRFRSRDNIGPFLLTMTASIEPEGQGGSRLSLHSDTEVSGPVRFVAPLLRPVFRRQMRRTLGRIREAVEETPQ